MTSLSGETLGRALALFAQAPLEITIEEACSRLCVPDSFGIIGRAIELERLLRQCEFELSPGLEHGELDSPRVLRRLPSSGDIHVEINKKIAAGEGVGVEFKSSLVFDHQKFAAVRQHSNPHADPASPDFRSEGVTHAALKTIAAFLNTHGGSLIIGVADDGSLLGLSWDYPAVGGNLNNGRDKWELHFKNLIGSRFLEGKTVMDYISVSVVKLNDVAVAYVTVTPRTKISYLLKEKSKNEFQCYKRNGNSTEAVEIQDMEEFIDKRRASARHSLTASTDLSPV